VWRAHVITGPLAGERGVCAESRVCSVRRKVCEATKATNGHNVSHVLGILSAVYLQCAGFSCLRTVNGSDAVTYGVE